MKRKNKQKNKTYNNHKLNYTKNNDKKEDNKSNLSEINHENTQFTKEFMASRKKVFKFEELENKYIVEDIVFDDEPEIKNAVDYKIDEITNSIALRNKLNRFFIDVDLINYDLDFFAVLFTARSKEIFKDEKIKELVENTLKKVFMFNLIDFHIYENYLTLKVKYNPMRSINSLLGTFIDNLISDLREQSEYSQDRLFSRSASIINNQIDDFSLDSIKDIISSLKANKIQKQSPNLGVNIVFVTRRNRHIFQDDIKDNVENEIKNFFETQKKFKIYKNEFEVNSNYILLKIKIDTDMKINELLWNIKRNLQNLFKKQYPEKLKGTALFSTSYCVTNKEFQDGEIQNYLDFHYSNYTSKKYHKIK